MNRLKARISWMMSPDSTTDPPANITQAENIKDHSTKKKIFSSTISIRTSSCADLDEQWMKHECDPEFFIAYQAMVEQSINNINLIYWINWTFKSKPSALN